MRGFFVFVALLGAVAGYTHRSPSQANGYIKPRDTTEDGAGETAATMIPAATSTTTAEPKPSTTILTSTASSLSSPKPTAETPIKDETELPSAAALGEMSSEPPSSLSPLLPIDEIESSKRRVITYDQRQEGQYNIRADLDNFMIVLIPPSPAEGLNLLDLLTKSNLRRNSLGSKNKRKQHFTSSNSAQPGGTARYRQAIRVDNNNQNFNYLPRQTPSGHHSHPQSIAMVESPASQRFAEFIEGRTPYHVDISANDEEHSRLQPDRQVDVLPPPYPLAYQHLIKPYHLEAEPTIIQALPPPEINASPGSFLETYNQLIGSNFKDDPSPKSHISASDDGNYYRVSRAIRGDTLFDANRVTSSNSLSSYPARREHLPIYRTDLSYGASSLYPPIDVPRLSGFLTFNPNSRTLELGSVDDGEQDLENAHVGEIMVSSNSANVADDLELDLRSIGFNNAEAKELLSGGMERCAPGRRRDSYGVCREIEGY